MPENQNMQKTSDNEAMLQEIVQNTEMGKNTLDELMGLTYDQKLKDEMMRQKNEYRRLNQQAHTALDAIGAQAKGQSAAARMSVSMGIRTRTMLDKSTRNLATMLAPLIVAGQAARSERLLFIFRNGNCIHSDILAVDHKLRVRSGGGDEGGGHEAEGKSAAEKQR